MKHLWLVGVTATAIAVIGPANGPAYAVPPPIPYSWTGCYIGGNVGLGWGSKEFQHPPSININDGIFGGFGGGQVGCDYQVAPHLVIGALGHFDAADISGSATEGSTQYSATVQSLFGAGGRVGYVNGGLLVYVDGGAAWAGDKYSVMTTLSTYTSSETAPLIK
jgi:outer membrane immunogenic protein